MSIIACAIDGCERAKATREWCRSHYSGLQRANKLPPKACKGCGNPCPGPRHYCSDDCIPRCTVEGCEDPRRNKEWCVFHFGRWKATGDATTPVTRLTYAPGQMCEVSGCRVKARRNKLCETHSGQMRRTGKTGGIRNKIKRPAELTSCCIEGCGGAIYAYLLCATHAWRLKNNGTTVLHKPKKQCKMPSCDRPPFGYGWCNMHYRRIQVNGSPFDKDQSWVYGIHVECIICGSPIPTERGNTRYCGNSCIWLAGDKDRPTSRVCPGCGDTVDLREKDANGNLRPRNRMVCGKCTRPKNLRKFIPSIISRDGSDCSICGELVDMDFEYPNPMSRSVDHIIPYSLGGANELSNYALSHLLCNIRKGNRTPGLEQ